MLDIGGDIGAAIVHTPPALAGSEIEIRHQGEPWQGRHVAVRARHVPSGVIHAALFPSLDSGRYEARVRGSGAAGCRCTFDVEGGRITERHLYSTSSRWEAKRPRRSPAGALSALRYAARDSI